MSDIKTTFKGEQQGLGLWPIPDARNLEHHNDPEYPRWFNAKTASRFQIVNVLAGNHPLGGNLKEHTTCGACSLRRKFTGLCSRLDLVGSHGKGLVVRTTWPGCHWFEGFR